MTLRPWLVQIWSRNITKSGVNGTWFRYKFLLEIIRWFQRHESYFPAIGIDFGRTSFTLTSGIIERRSSHQCQKLTMLVQGYLAHQKPPRPRTLQQTFAQGPVVVPGGGLVSYERGSPVKDSQISRVATESSTFGVTACFRAQNLCVVYRLC